MRHPPFRRSVGANRADAVAASAAVSAHSMAAETWRVVTHTGPGQQWPRVPVIGHDRLGAKCGHLREDHTRRSQVPRIEDTRQ